MRRKALSLALAAVLVGLLSAVPAAHANGVPLNQGDVLAGVGSGIIKHFNSNGVLLDSLDNTTGSTYDTGMCSDSAHKLYATNFDGGMSKFDGGGNLLAASFGSGFNRDPESCVVDAADHVYVGQADGSGNVLKFDTSGALLATYAPARDDRGTDWVDLASDQCTLHYTSESDSIKQFNVCTNTQLPDFVTGLPGPCYAHRILSDGSELVACSTVVEHVSSSGSIVKTYSPGGTGNLFALNLDPDGTSFWTGDVSSGDVWRIDIATGAVLKTFNTGINTALGGLSIVGEITAAVGPPSATITTPPDGASYQVGQVVNANYSCAAGSNGTLQSCVGSVANGSPIDTSTAGPHTFTVTATDTDGQTATAVSHYTVNKVPTFINANPVLVQLSGLKIYLKPSATLYRTSPTAPLAGKTVKFYAGSTFVCQGTTDSNGLASCSGLLPLLQTTLSLGYTATFDGDSTYLPSSGKGPLLK